MSRTILVVIDDSELDQAIFNEIFKQQYDVKTFKSSRSAMRFIKEQQPSIAGILLDVCLEFKNEGFAVLRDLKDNEETRNLPVILMSADANKKTVLSGVESGAVDFLVKPVNPHHVQERVTRMVQDTWNLIQEEQPEEPSQQSTAGSFFLIEEDMEAMCNRWIRRMIMLTQYRSGFSIAQFRIVHDLVAVLAENYVKTHPAGPLKKADIKMMSAASTFYDIGFLGIPDDVLKAGRYQPEPGQSLYLKHTDVGKEMFRTPNNPHPYLRYCGEIAYWHHKNYDGSGYPVTDGPVEIPLSGQIARTALRLNYHMRRYLNHDDSFSRAIRSLGAEVGCTISPEMYEVVRGAMDQLAMTMRIHYHN